jgi:hypothetical protein
MMISPFLAGVQTKKETTAPEKTSLSLMCAMLRQNPDIVNRQIAKNGFLFLWIFLLLPI